MQVRHKSCFRCLGLQSQVKILGKQCSAVHALSNSMHRSTLLNGLQLDTLFVILRNYLSEFFVYPLNLRIFMHIRHQNYRLQRVAFVIPCEKKVLPLKVALANMLSFSGMQTISYLRGLGANKRSENEMYAHYSVVFFFFRFVFYNILFGKFGIKAA